MERILVVDDEASIRKALQIGLTSNSFEVDLASDGFSGVQLGQKRAYDILIADLCLPDMNGLELVKKIKDVSPEIIPIVITGKGDMQSSLEAIRLEVVDYLEKPLSLMSVKNSIARGIERRAKKLKAAEMLAHQQLHLDSLTGLWNRSQFMGRLERLLAEEKRDEDSFFAVFLIDIDRFKNINDAYGLITGDRVLMELANRFKACVSSSDTVARMNGDEFSVLIEKACSRENVIAIAENCRRLAEEPILVDGFKITLRISIGIVMEKKFYQSPHDVCRDAEIALTHCKDHGGGRVQVFERKMLEQAVESLQLENELRMGIQNREFVLYYQPIIRMRDRRLDGFEALIRWNHPERGIVYPGEFIPKAEEIGLINPIGNWVVAEACRQMKEWQDTIPGIEKITLNVNISGCQLLQPGFAHFVAEVIHQTGVDPANLKFELTESILMERSKISIETVNALKEIGIKLAIDDFGTGYSSLSCLQQFPIDDLKVGHSFVQEMAKNPECCEIVKTIVDLAKRLVLNLVAEGVETKEQLKKVKTLDFDLVQGFLLSFPVDSESATQIIKNSLAKDSFYHPDLD